MNTRRDDVVEGSEGGPRAEREPGPPADDRTRLPEGGYQEGFVSSEVSDRSATRRTRGINRRTRS